MMNSAGRMVLVCGLILSTASAQDAPPPQPAPSTPPAQPTTPPATPPAETPKPADAPSTQPAPQPATQPAAEPTPAPATPPEKTAEPKPTLTPKPSPLDPEAGAPAPRIVEPVEGGESIEAVIHLRDGRRMNGYLVRRDEKETVLRIQGVDSPVPEASIDRVEILPSVLDRYKLLREAISDDDVDRLVMLAEWLLSRKQYDLALKELTPVVEKHPDRVDARKLKLAVETQRTADEAGAKLRERRGPVPEGAPGQTQGSKSQFPTLAQDDINLLRVYQADLDNPPKMVVPRELVDELIRRYADRPQIPSTQEGREALYRKRPGQILRIVFELKARELYGMIRILEEPKPLRAFRDNVWRGWILNTCATSRCHGGEEAGRLWLLNAKTNAESTVYTNLMILHQYKLPDGTPLINYDKPAESPLLQMAMRPESSKMPHPRIDSIGKGDKYRAVFNSPEERRFQETVEWIKSMYVPQGRDYPISYTPPISESAKALGKDGKKSDPGR